MKSYVTGSQWDSNPDVTVQCLDLGLAMEANPFPLAVPLPPSSTPGGSSRPVLAHAWNVTIPGNMCPWSCVGMCKYMCVAEYRRVKAGSGRDILMATVSSKAAREERDAMIDITNVCGVWD